MTVENKEQSAETTDPVEVLESSAETVVRTIGKDEYEMLFTQKPLSFFGKMDFFSVLGRALDLAMSGPDGMSVADILDVPDRGVSLNVEDYKDADLFVRGIAKVMTYAPEILAELYCVILAVPKGQRRMVTQVMEMDPEEGGLDDETGVDILEVFIDQNWEVMTDFFSGRMTGLFKKVNEKMTVPKSQSSKRSNTSRRSTAKASKS